MKKFFILSTMAMLLLSACSLQNASVADEEVQPETDEFGLTVGQEEEAQAAQALKMKEVACEDSGGTFDGENCECPDETYGEDWPLYTYDEETGYCMDAFGIPGGALGQEATKNNPASE